MTRDWFVLYRPAAPAVRAQTVQVLASAGALAERGHRVTVCVQTTSSDAAIRRAHGLPDALELVRLPPGNTLASAAYRLAFARFVCRTEGRGVALARAKRHADWALRWFGGRFRLVVEMHEVDSLHPDRNRQAMRRLEERVLRRAWGVVTNAAGTLADLRHTHRTLPPARVIPNAARPGGPPADPGHDVGWVGSVRPEKDPDTVVAAVRTLALRVVLVGPTPGEAAPLVQAAEGRLHLEAARTPVEVPDRLRRFRALIVPLSPGRFGERWTSPLKLFDALASGVPMVAADTPAVRAVAEGAYVPYTPGDVGSLRKALVRATTDPRLRARVSTAAQQRSRTWTQRAAEVESFVDEVLG
ncbi:MAG: glycosyltransferase [Myxococcota bacterium]